MGEQEPSCRTVEFGIGNGNKHILQFANPPLKEDEIPDVPKLTTQVGDFEFPLHHNQTLVQDNGIVELVYFESMFDIAREHPIAYLRRVAKAFGAMAIYESQLLAD